MLAFINIVGVGLAHEERTRPGNKKSGEPVVFTITEHEGFEGRDEGVVHKGNKEHSSKPKVEFFVKPNASEHVPATPCRSKSRIEFMFVGPCVGQPHS